MRRCIRSQENIKVSRMALPMIKTVQTLLEARVLDRCVSSLSSPFAAELTEVLRSPLRCKDLPLLLSAANVQVLLLPYATGATLSEGLRSLLLLLAHRYPKVRKAVADLLYVHLITYGVPSLPCGEEVEAGAPAEVEGDGLPVDSSKMDDLMSVLLETPWLDSIDQHARPARAKLLELLHLPPVSVAAEAPTVDKSKKEGTYKELVGEMGY